QVEVSPHWFVPHVEGTLELVAGLTKPRPIGGWVIATRAIGPAQCEVKVPEDGRFTMNLPAGSYRFAGTRSNLKGCRALNPVVLKPRPSRSRGGPAIAVVTCDA